MEHTEKIIDERAQGKALVTENKKGTNVLGLIEAAEKLGFEAKGVCGTYFVG